MTRTGYFDADYLRRRNQVHRLNELGFENDQISRTLQMSHRNVLRYLAMPKPILEEMGCNYAWVEDAACAIEHSEYFFPSVTGLKSRSLKEQAMQICAGCPVSRQCKESALSHYENVGVWGGVDFSKYVYEFDEVTGRVRVNVKEPHGALAQVG